MGAILQLRVADVFDVRGGVREVVTFAAKTRKGKEGKRQTRQVAIHPELRAFLESYQVPDSVYLFPSPLSSDQPIGYDSVYQYWQYKFNELGLDHRGFSCHSTRRWFITQLVRNGTDLKTVQQITGHKDTKVLLGYVEADEKRARGAIAAIQV